MNALEAIIIAWIREDAPLAAKMNLMPEHVRKLSERISAALPPEPPVLAAHPTGPGEAEPVAVSPPLTGSEEEAFWLEAAMQYGFEQTDDDDKPTLAEENYRATGAQILELMAAARTQGRKDVRFVAAPTPPAGDAGAEPAGERQEGCILCCNGNDLPEGEYCRACGRTRGGLGAALDKVEGRMAPPTAKVAFARTTPAEPPVSPAAGEDLKGLSAKAAPGPWTLHDRYITAKSTNPHIGDDDVVVSSAYSDRSLKDDAHNLRYIHALVEAHRSGALLPAASRPDGQGEPVAWAWEYRSFGGEEWFKHVSYSQPPAGQDWVRNICPLYAHPAPAASRPAVGREALESVIYSAILNEWERPECQTQRVARKATDALLALLSDPSETQTGQGDK